MSQERILVEDLVDGAIIAGYQSGAQTFLASLEEQLQTSQAITESGDAHELLQSMIDESEGISVAQESSEQLSSLDEKLSRVLR